MLEERLKQFFTLLYRYRRSNVALVRNVALDEIRDLQTTTSSPRVRVAINRFLCTLDGEETTSINH